MEHKPWFFLIWNLAGGPPTHRHDSYESAEAEARRLANSFPGQEFHIVKAIASVKRVEPVTVTELEDPDIPL